MAGVSMGGSGGADFSKYMKDILHSDVFLSKIVEREWRVYEDRGDTVTLKEFWELEPDTTEKHWQRKLKKSMHERLKSKIDYSMDKESGLVKITTLFNTPFLATEVNRFIVRELNNIILNKLRFKAREKREFIERRLEEVKKELREAENQLKSFRQNNRRVNSSPALMLRQERLIRNVEIKGTVYKELLKQYETSKIEEKKDVPVLDIIDPAQIPVDDNLSGKKVVLIAGFAGIFLGILAAMGVEFYSKYKEDIISIISS